MELVAKVAKQLFAYLHKKTPSQMSDRVLITPQSQLRRKRPQCLEEAPVMF